MQAHDLHYQRPTPWHSEQAKAAKPEKGLASIALGAKALALTALDLIEDPALLPPSKRIKPKRRHGRSTIKKTFYLLTYYTILDIMPLIQKKGGGRSDQSEDDVLLFQACVCCAHFVAAACWKRQQAGGAAACFFVTQNRHEKGRFTVERKPV